MTNNLSMPHPDGIAGVAAARRDRLLFTRAQLLGWTLFGVITFLSVAPQTSFPMPVLFSFKMVWAGTGFAISSGLAVLYRSLRLANRPLGVAIGSAVVLSALVAVTWVMALGAMTYGMHGETHMIYTRATFPVVASNHIFILWAWSGGYLALVYWRRSEGERQKSLAAIGLAKEAQLEMLRYQLSPHFLFNAMTSVRALIREHPERARETLTRLADFLRYALGARDGAMVRVADEMRLVEDYLAIERVRFEEQLETSVMTDRAAASEKLPVFLVHTLVENAVKHGMASNGRLTVNARATIEDRALRIDVSNTGQLRPPRPGDGEHLGLRNVRERLNATFPGRHTFELTEADGIVRAIVTIQTETQG